MTERLILVDETDREIGTEEKLTTHRRGLLHRAFSVFLLDRQAQVLLQRRAEGKYHSAGLWSNTCCGHPRPGEGVRAAAHRRLREEMGIDCRLEPAGAFTYRAELARGLVEHEYDHVFAGAFDGEPTPDPQEVSAWRWIPVDDILEELHHGRAEYTAWFRQALDTLLSARRPAARRAETRRGSRRK